MSDDEARTESTSASESEDVETTGLIATRQKRVTAGNLYATLRANLDDEELQKDLLAEDDAGDAGDYEGSHKGEEDDDDDEALESSSDEDDQDAGPPKEGEAEDLAGEKELKTRERVEAKKKRKLNEARLKLPAWQKKKQKRVKLADDVKTEDGGTIERPPKKKVKKSERSNWLPTSADAPTRQSERSLAVANREVIHANLKQSYERSEKQRRVMQNAAEREKTKKRADLTQVERFKMAARIEKQTEREFGRLQREEAERQRKRDEDLAAKRRRATRGPVIRYWSGSVLWEGDRIKVRRMSHGSKNLDELREKEKKQQVEDSKRHANDENMQQDIQHAVSCPTPSAHLPNTASQTAAETSDPDSQIGSTADPTTAPTTASAPPQPPVPWLQGIHDYASQPPPQVPSQEQPPPSTVANGYSPSTPSLNVAPTAQPAPPAASTQQTQQTSAPFQLPPQIYHGWPPGAHESPVQLTPPPPPPPPPLPPAPLIREQAQRSLIILDQFEELENASRRNKTASILEPTATATTLLASDVYPSFTAEETRYLTAKYKKKGNEHYLTQPPAKTRCAITSWPAKFRDPKTGLAYADMHTYKIIQRILAGGCQWSGLLGAWVGPRYGPMGRPAQGVPEGFAAPLPTTVKAETAN